MKFNPRKQLFFGTALIGALITSYGRRAYAGSCVESAPGSGIWDCSGAAAPGTDVDQTLTPAAGGALTITTSSGFGIDTSYHGFKLGNNIGDVGGISFIDNNTSSISGGNTAINVRYALEGPTYIKTTGAVHGGFEGILVISNYNSKDVTIKTSGTVTAGGRAIHVRNYGMGAVDITSTASITSTTLEGIYAFSLDANSTTLKVTTADVSGARNGIIAWGYGTGLTEVTTYGIVSGTDGAGIYGFANQSALEIATGGAVTGTTHGIKALNFGTSIDITNNDTVTSTAGFGIWADNQTTNTTDLTITSNAAVTGFTDGINASSTGTGAIKIDTTGGTIEGISGLGVLAANNNGTDITIDTVNVSGKIGAISALNNGSGALKITSTGLAKTDFGNAIAARNFGTDLIINAMDVTADQDLSSTNNVDIDARNFGTGRTVVNATGTLTSNAGGGIFSINHGSSLTITSVDISANAFGVWGKSNKGIVSITSTGDINSGLYNNGIRVDNYYGGSYLIVESKNVTSDDDGIFTVNDAAAAATITTHGITTSTNGNGIYGYNGSDTTVLSITVGGAVSGKKSGIRASNFGKGVLTVTANDNVTGTDDFGIVSYNGSSSIIAAEIAVSNLSTVQGGTAGISAGASAGQTTKITNKGVVQNLSGLATATAIISSDGSVVVDNTGLHPITETR